MVEAAGVVADADVVDQGEVHPRENEAAAFTYRHSSLQFSQSGSRYSEQTADVRTSGYSDFRSYGYAPDSDCVTPCHTYLHCQHFSSRLALNHP